MAERSLKLKLLKAGTHLAIITIITIKITGTNFFKYLGDKRYYVLIIDRFYRNLAPHLRKILLGMMSVIHRRQQAEKKKVLDQGNFYE